MQAVALKAIDGPVFLLNLNKYSTAVGFTDGSLYKEYMRSINKLVKEVE